MLSTRGPSEQAVGAGGEETEGPGTMILHNRSAPVAAMHQAEFEQSVTLYFEPREQPMREGFAKVVAKEVQRPDEVVERVGSTHVAVVTVAVLAWVAPGGEFEEMFDHSPSKRERFPVVTEPNCRRKQR